MIRMHLNCYNRLRMKLQKLAERNIQTPYQHISDGAAADLDEIQQHRERIKENGIALTGINTGYAI